MLSGSSLEMMGDFVLIKALILIARTKLRLSFNARKTNHHEM